MSFNSDDSKEYSGAKEVDKLPEICVIGNANKYLSASLGVLSCIDPNSLRKISTYIACGSSSIIAVLLALSIPISSIREILMTTTIVDNIYNHIPTKRKTTGLMSIFSSNDNKNILLLEELKLWFEKILKNLGYSSYLTFANLSNECILCVENTDECKVYTLSKSTTPTMLLSDAIRLSLLQYKFQYEEEIITCIPTKMTVERSVSFGICLPNNQDDDDNDNDVFVNSDSQSMIRDLRLSQGPAPPSTLPYSLMQSSNHIQLKSEDRLFREEKKVKINTSGVLCHYPIELALAEKSRQEVHLGNKQVRGILGIQTVLNLPLYSIDEIFHTKDCQMLRKDNLIGSKETFIDYQLKRNMNERYISSTIHVDVTDYMSDNVTSYHSHMLMFKEGQKSFISHMEEKHRSIKRE